MYLLAKGYRVIRASVAVGVIVTLVRTDTIGCLTRELNSEQALCRVQLN